MKKDENLNFFKSQAAVQDFEMKLEECLAVNDNPNVDNGDYQENLPRKINAAVVKRRGGKNVKKPQARRRGQKKVSSESEASSSDSETENQPPRRKGQRVIIESDDEVEAPKSSTRASRASRSKVVYEATSSGKKRLSENNSF